MCHDCQPGNCAKRMEVVAAPAIGEASRQQDGGGEQTGRCLGTRHPSVPAGKSEPWGVWHSELPSSFQMQLPGQHCGFLCASEKQGPTLRGLCFGAEVEG